MQVMPFWRKELGREQDNLTHIETNIRYGTTILAYYLERADGDLVDALARYNGSLWSTEIPGTGGQSLAALLAEPDLSRSA